MEDEENFLIEQYESARQRVFETEETFKEAKFQKDKAARELEEMRQALIDFMEGNGLVSTERLWLSKTVSLSVDIIDVDSVPDEYIRIKREPNKAAIKALKLPESNWLKYKETTNYRLEVK